MSIVDLREDQRSVIIAADLNTHTVAVAALITQAWQSWDRTTKHRNAKLFNVISGVLTLAATAKHQALQAHEAGKPLPVMTGCDIKYEEPVGFLTEYEIAEGLQNAPAKVFRRMLYHTAHLGGDQGGCNDLSAPEDHFCDVVRLARYLGAL